MAFLGEGWVSVHLDARRDGVRLPADLTDTRHLVLQYGRDMPIPIPDLVVGEDGIHATLSFSRTPHQTFIPWTAIYIVSCTDGRGILYYEDVPEDVSVAVRSADGEGPSLPGSEPDLDDLAPPGEMSEADTEPVRAPFLRSVPTDPNDSEPPPASERAAPVRRRRRPQLKVVK
jgi:stringent starvation protein B